MNEPSVGLRYAYFYAFTQPYIKEVVKTLFTESSRKWWGGETASEAKSFSTSVRKRERKAINFWISKKSSLTIPEICCKQQGHCRWIIFCHVEILYVNLHAKNIAHELQFCIYDIHRERPDRPFLLRL